MLKRGKRRPERRKKDAKNGKGRRQENLMVSAADDLGKVKQGEFLETEKKTRGGGRENISGAEKGGCSGAGRRGRK